MEENKQNTKVTEQSGNKSKGSEFSEHVVSRDLSREERIYRIQQEKKRQEQTNSNISNNKK